MADLIRFPWVYVPDPTKGRPVFNGSMFFGLPDQDPEIVSNQKQVFVIQEDGTEVAVSQPVTLGAGGVPLFNGSPVQLSILGDFALKVLDKQGSQVFFAPNVKPGGDGDSTQTVNHYRIVATAGQTVFTSPESYTQGIGQLSVFLDGVKLAIDEEYTETTDTTFTLSTGALAGQNVDIYIGSITPIVQQALDVTYTYPGGVTRDVQDRLEDIVSVKDFGAKCDGVTDDSAAVTSAILKAMEVGAALHIPGDVFIGSVVDVTTTGSLTIFGGGRDISTLQAGAIDCLIIRQSTITHHITIRDLGFVPLSASSGKALTLDGSANVSGGLLSGRTELKATLQNLKFTAPAAASQFEWSVCLNFLSFDKFALSDIITRGNQNHPHASIGILINGDGNMVEMYITKWHGYQHASALEVADEHEGLFLDKFNLVSVTNGLMMGVNTSNTLGAAADLKTLGNTISNGHINCSDNAIIFSDTKANQNFLSNVLAYCSETPSTPADTIRELVTFGPGSNNHIDDLSIIVLDATTADELQPIFIDDNTNSSFKGITISDAINTTLDISGSNMIDINGSSNISVELNANANANVYDSAIKMANSVTNCKLIVTSTSEFSNGYYQPTSGIVPVNNVYGGDSLQRQSVVLSSGQPHQDITIPLRAGQYGQAPLLCEAEQTTVIAAAEHVKFVYDYSSSDADNAAFRIYPSDAGANLPAGTITVVSRVVQP